MTQREGEAMDDERTCDYCDDGNVAVNGWHQIEDPEGLEGIANVPCARVAP